MTRRLAAAAALATVLLVPATAAAGGWATVGLDPPDGVGPGETWPAELTILQHGISPLAGVKPRVIVTRGDARRVYAATPTGEPGVYRAEVVFPTAGTWRYAVDDGFSATHTFPPVRVGGGEASKTVAAASASTPSRDGGGPDIWLALAAAGGAGLIAVLGSAALQRRRPAPEGG
jgi:hypothetical protein